LPRGRAFLVSGELLDLTSAGAGLMDSLFRVMGVTLSQYD
jgi:hypothetical protein